MGPTEIGDMGDIGDIGDIGVWGLTVPCRPVWRPAESERSFSSNLPIRMAAIIVRCWWSMRAMTALSSLPWARSSA